MSTNGEQGASEPVDALRLPFNNSYARLPARFFQHVLPTPVTAPRLIEVNDALALELGLEPAALRSVAGIRILAGNAVAGGSEPLAMAYAGSQFGNFVAQLGDGRANLLGELVTPDGKRYDVQLKGAGPTAFSRRGDGRAALGPVLREYIVSEAMNALGVPTTRALAAVSTGDRVLRETMLPGAVLTRVAASHLRVGTFQYFAARGDVEALRVLAHYAMERHYPGAAQAARPTRALLDGVIMRQAQLVAQWMALGFIHGVMNTDNTSISGETIDYGPCAFMEAYGARTVFSSIDRQGRYAYSNQPHAMHWNLTRLAESLLPLLVEEYGGDEAGLAAAYEALAAFGPQYEAAWDARFRSKLGLLTQQAGDRALAEGLLALMEAHGADFTLTFRSLADLTVAPVATGMFAAAGAAWFASWRERIAAEGGDPLQRADTMQAANPAYVPRNHRVQAMIDAAVGGDYGPFRELLAVLQRPFAEQAQWTHYRAPATSRELVTATFCGT